MLGKRKFYGGKYPRGAKKAVKSTQVKKYSNRQPARAASWNKPSFTPFGSGRQAAKLIYCEKEISVNPGLGVAATYQFALSSLFDPNVTGVGHQPSGFDQYMAMYSDFLVTDCVYKVVFDYAAQTSGASALIVGCTVNDDSATTTDCRRYIENGNTQYKVVSARGDGTCTASISGSVDMAKAHGVPFTQYIADNIFRGTASASPSEMIYLDVWAQDIDTGDAGTCKLFVELQFSCIFYGPKLNDLS